MSFLKADRAEQPHKSAEEAHRLGIGFDTFRTSNFHQSSRSRKLPFLALINTPFQPPQISSGIVNHIAFSYNQSHSLKKNNNNNNNKKG
ncbi:hypothetical protein PGTUg99_017685 [Puccinia graminis f. sp. tritici]|uniref:Uncharacterized protein n=1 Tax=Puccinia graminis f. sp. tritici TaxID=56615 RepID=A0A5B0NGW4_PUCGR|nr:hypothetical protein PGTUg99_017685 [Puccinia graminis f. sp. tritici]